MLMLMKRIWAMQAAMEKRPLQICSELSTVPSTPSSTHTVLTLAKNVQQRKKIEYKLSNWYPLHSCTCTVSDFFYWRKNPCSQTVPLISVLTLEEAAGEVSFLGEVSFNTPPPPLRYFRLLTYIEKLSPKGKRPMTSVCIGYLVYVLCIRGLATLIFHIL